ncbi:MAG TPA: glycosyltransferase [Puia sp.]|nr:glycosyltransferase [Puia sp.]
MNPAPIALFAYKRPDHLKRVVDSLLRNALAPQSELFIFSDGPRNTEVETAVAELRKYLRTITGFKKVIITERAENFGLAKNIIDGVTSVVDLHGKIIVLEDDLVLSPYYLEFMNEALEKYQDVEEVISIHGYSYPISYAKPVYFLRGADCWGWGTWKRGWDLFNPDTQFLLDEIRRKDLSYAFNMDDSYDYTGMLKAQIEGRVDSWAIRWYASAFLENKLTLYAYPSLLENIGMDDATHGQDPGLTDTDLTDHRIVLEDIPVEETIAARKLIARHLYRNMPMRAKIKRLLKRGLGS